MREIDTDALLGVASSLKVQNPGTATRQVRFDDENLQQMWDASKFSRFPRLTAGIQETVAAAIGTVERAALSRSELFGRAEYDATLAELGLDDPSKTDVYVLSIPSVTVELSNVANLEEVQAGVRFQVPEQAANPLICFTGSSALGGQTNLLVAGVDQILANNTGGSPETADSMFPHRLEGQGVSGADPDELFHLVEAGGGGGVTCQFKWLLHFCVRGMPLWYTP